MNAPLVSAVILSHNYERYVGEAIDSARAQTHGPIEVVLVDDGSSDSTREVAAAHPPDVRAWISPNRGVSTARNVGLSLARGDYIGFLDGDDVWTPDKVKRQLAALWADPAPDLVLGQVEEFLSPDAPAELVEGLRVAAKPQPARLLGAMLAPRRTWERVGPWTENLHVADGLDWFLRADRLGLREARVEDLVMRRRIHGRNLGVRNRRESHTEFIRLIKGRLDERRREAS